MRFRWKAKKWLVGSLLLAPLVLCAQTSSCPDCVVTDPTSSQTITQPAGTSFNPNYFTAQTFNGTVEADQFPGADMCAKIVNAALALPATGGIIEATHFTGAQSCSVDPLVGLVPIGGFGPTAPAVTLEFGNVVINSTVPWTIAGQKLVIVGKGRAQTQLIYTTNFPATSASLTYTSSTVSGSLSSGNFPAGWMGKSINLAISGASIASFNNNSITANITSSTAFTIPTVPGYAPTSGSATGTIYVPAVISVRYAPYNGTSVNSSLTGIAISHMGIIGNSSVPDGLFTSGNHFSNYTDLGFWGVSNCGYHSEWAVDDTLTNLRASTGEAILFGYPNTPPQSLLCLDQLTSATGTDLGQTTNATVTDANASSVLGIGWDLISANSMVFNGGTSEGNRIGVQISAASQSNTFIGSDWEGNATQDVNDYGGSTQIINPIAVSGSKAIEFSAGSTGSVLKGGIVSGYQIDPGASPSTIDESLHVNPIPTKLSLRATGGTNDGGISVSPAGNVTGMWKFTGGTEVTLFALPFNGSNPWKAILRGSWGNTVDGTTVAMPGFYTEVSSASPTLMVGTELLIFSLNSSNELQAEYNNGSNQIWFDGTIIPVSYDYFTNYPDSMDLSGNVKTSASIIGSSIQTGTATWTSGSGVPHGNCGVSSLYSNSSAINASTVLYVCYPANTWNPVTVP